MSNSAVTQCPFCQPNTGGDHESWCPQYQPSATVIKVAHPLEGWICPRCKTVHAPWVSECDCLSPFDDSTTYPYPIDSDTVTWSPLNGDWNILYNGNTH